MILTKTTICGALLVSLTTATLATPAHAIDECYKAKPNYEQLGKVVNQIKVPEHETAAAKLALDRMLAIS